MLVRQQPQRAHGRTLGQRTWPEIEPHHDLIKGWLGEVTVSTIHQRLRDDHGLSATP